MTEAIFVENVATWMVRTRKRLGMTQLRLALTLKVKRSTVCAWERGTRTISLYRYLQLKKTFEQYEKGNA